MRGMGSGDKLLKQTAKWWCFRKGREGGGNFLYMTSNKWSFGFKTTLLPLDLMIIFGVYDTIYICFLKWKNIMRKHRFAPSHAPFEYDVHFTPLHPSSHAHLVYLNLYCSSFSFFFFKSYSCRCCGTDMVYEKYVFIKCTVFFFISLGYS